MGLVENIPDLDPEHVGLSVVSISDNLTLIPTPRFPEPRVLIQGTGMVSFLLTSLGCCTNKEKK